MAWRPPTLPPPLRAAPPRHGAQGGSTFDKLGLLPEPAHAAPNPQENSCRQPKTMLIKYAAIFPSPSNPSGCWITDPSLARFLGFWPKTAQAQGPHLEIELIKLAAVASSRPQPLPPTLEDTTTRGCTGSKLGFHSRPPRIRRPITVQKPNTMLIRSATHTPNKSPHPIQSDEDRNFRGNGYSRHKRHKRPQSRAPNPHLTSAHLNPTPGLQQPCLGDREPVIPRWMPGL